jgi:Rps23 Pro-64 3,4-dihydroxylase Tpa1-like proline 4-hydroxylase
MKFIKRFESFLSEKLYDETIKTARHLVNSSSMCFATHRCWNPDIVKDSFPVFIHSISPDSEFYDKLNDEFVQNLEPFFSEQKIKTQMNPEFMLYYWTRFSYIPWHSDANFYGGLTVYLNEEWDQDWGGYFMYKNEDGSISAIPPQRNTAVLQFGGVPHSTTPVHYSGELRITLQVFFNK